MTVHVSKMTLSPSDTYTLKSARLTPDPPPGGGGRKPAQSLEPQPHLLNPGGQRHVQLAHHVRTIDSIGLQAMPILELLQRRDHARIEAFGSWRSRAPRSPRSKSTGRVVPGRAARCPPHATSDRRETRGPAPARLDGTESCEPFFHESICQARRRKSAERDPRGRPPTPLARARSSPANARSS